jgi:integrase
VETIIFYATDLTQNQKKKRNTLPRRRVPVSPLHQEAGFPSPTQTWPLKQFLAGLRRELGTAPERKRPLLVEDLREILLDQPDSNWGKRDRAVLLLGFTGAFRRSELVALDVTDLEETRDGLIVSIRKSKTDQEGQGRRVGLPPGADEASCPRWALNMWRSVGGIEEGAIFRVMNRHDQVLPKRLSGEGVGIVVKRSVEGLRLDPSQFAGHSLRAGLATSAAAAGKSERAILQQTGHRSVRTVWRYVREGNLFRENAAEGLGL